MERFPDNARVCFIGDSITATFNYEGRIAAFYRENFRDSKVRIYDCGVAGGTASFQLECLSEDTLIHKPTHAVITLGVNDSQRWLLDTEKNEIRYDDLKKAYETYKKNLRALCDAVENEGIKITLCTPPPYAEYQEHGDPALKGGYALIAGYADFCRDLAKERSYPLCDYHEYLTRVLQTEEIYSPDRIHPTDRGQYYMAKCFLEFQGLDIGEQKPLPDEFNELVSEAMILRDILAVELMVIRDYHLPTDKKFEIVQKYIDEKKAPTEYFARIVQVYMAHKNRWDEHMARVIELTDELMG